MDLESIDSEEDKQGLLDPNLRSVRRWSNNASRSGRCHTLHLVVLYMVNIIVTISLLWSIFHKKDPSTSIYSPADSAISYKTTVFTPGMPDNPSPYQGEPTPEKNKLWEDLYVGVGASRVTKQEAERMINDTYELPETDGDHVVTIEVFHQLHCLNILRRIIWPEQFPDRALTGPDGQRIYGRVVHADHCIDRLRQGIMCASPVGVSTWKTPPKAPREGNTFEERLATDMKIMTTCRDFDTIWEWANERVVEGWIDAT